MEKFTEIIDQAVPWVLFAILIFFTLVLVSNIYGIFKAKKVDPTLRLALNSTGKIAMGLLYGAYFLIFAYTIFMEIQVFADQSVTGMDKVYLALNAANLLTVVTFLAAIEFQDIFFIGEKNIYIAGRMYEIRRMRKASFPKKHTLVFVYGQKEYNFSTRFVEVGELKPKLKR